MDMFITQWPLLHNDARMASVILYETKIQQ